jgi:catechol 2,3-dioxygenase-like lactoylglutathione lyase family enzyme
VPEPRATLAAAVLDSDDPRRLAAFYSALLGWPVAVDEPPRPGLPPEDAWVMLRAPNGGVGLSFQYEGEYVAPAWPAERGAQQMMLHLDIGVDDLDAAVARAVELGATLADHQPQDGVRVLLDPAGHPFCLFPDA